MRTTTRYGSPAQRFRAVHERLAQEVQERAALSVGFNNALIETYTNAYTTMGSHSDQALDLAAESFIAVFSCYQNPEAGPPRKLTFEPKEPGGEKFEIPLTHNSIVAFSVTTNRRLKHKITLDAPAQTADNQWLGVTFRTSKTLIHFRDGHAYLANDARLTPADDEQQREFYQLRRRENNETDFVYPPLTYTISASDVLPPV
nr:alpha-ketoglutarate-dependent dioxygenase AlkB [Catenulispora rubra]